MMGRCDPVETEDSLYLKSSHCRVSMRAKWSAPVRKYWKYSEKKMVMGSDMIVCDLVNMGKYIQKTYGVKNTTFIAYGAETRKSECPEEKYEEWLNSKGLRRNEYLLAA